MTVNLKYYKSGEGLDLHDFHIMSVKEITTCQDAVFGYQPDMFFGMYAYMGQGQGSPMFSNHVKMLKHSSGKAVIVLSDNTGTQIPVSRNYYKELRKFIVPEKIIKST